MKINLLVMAATAVAVFSGCETEPLTPQCTSLTSQQASVDGDTVTTSTGLQYIETQMGTGDTAQACRVVGIHYTLYLTDGTAIDSFQTPNLVYAFTPGQGGLIRGVEEGVLGMRVGGSRRLIIPPDLGYGSTPQIRNGVVIIPANSTLIFDIRLLATEGQ